MKRLLLLLDRPRVEIGALTLYAVAEVVGWVADTTAAKAERYAAAARWVAAATRCVP